MPGAIKTIRSHVGFARFLAQLDQDSEGLPLVIRRIPRPKNIPSPYRHEPDWPVYRYRDQEVIVSETAHRKYQVFLASSLQDA